MKIGAATLGGLLLATPLVAQDLDGPVLAQPTFCPDRAASLRFLNSEARAAWIQNCESQVRLTGLRVVDEARHGELLVSVGVNAGPRVDPETILVTFRLEGTGTNVTVPGTGTATRMAQLQYDVCRTNVQIRASAVWKTKPAGSPPVQRQMTTATILEYANTRQDIYWVGPNGSRSTDGTLVAHVGDVGNGRSIYLGLAHHSAGREILLESYSILCSRSGPDGYAWERCDQDPGACYPIRSAPELPVAAHCAAEPTGHQRLQVFAQCHGNFLVIAMFAYETGELGVATALVDVVY